jgi:plastocyanin
MWTYAATPATIKVSGGTGSTTTTTTTSNVPVGNGDIVFDFGSYEAKPGDTVTVDVKLASGSVAVASMDVKYKLDSPLTITNFGKKSEAYNNAAVESNTSTNQQSFISLDGSEPIVGTVGSSVFKFVVTVPENCADGTYSIDFANCEIYKSGANSEMWTYAATPATIKVSGNGSTTSSTTTSTTTTTTTTTAPTGNGDIVFDFGTYEAKPGDTVTVDVKLASGNVAVASMDVEYKVDSPLTITNFGKKSEAYGNAAVESNPDTNQQSFISLNGSEPIVGTVGSSVFRFVITVPENVVNGTYNIGFKNCEIYKSGANSEMWTWDAIGGTITVDGGKDRPKYSGVGDRDRNKKVTAIDASLILAYVADINAGTATVTEEDLWICDVNRDGKITSVDSSIILCYYADIAAGYEGTFVDYLVEKIGVERSSVEDQ